MLNNVPIGGSNHSLVVLRTESVVLSLSHKYDVNLPQCNKWQPTNNMCQPSLEGQGYDKLRGGYNFINQSNQILP